MVHLVTDGSLTLPVASYGHLRELRLKTLWNEHVIMYTGFNQHLASTVTVVGPTDSSVYIRLMHKATPI